MREDSLARGVSFHNLKNIFKKGGWSLFFFYRARTNLNGFYVRSWCNLVSSCRPDRKALSSRRVSDKTRSSSSISRVWSDAVDRSLLNEERVWSYCAKNFNPRITRSNPLLSPVREQALFFPHSPVNHPITRARSHYKGEPTPKYGIFLSPRFIPTIKRGEGGVKSLLREGINSF